jgi:hypothetical protein
LEERNNRENQAISHMGHTKSPCIPSSFIFLINAQNKKSSVFPSSSLNFLINDIQNKTSVRAGQHTKKEA